jgi:hypothetical protein
MVSSTKSSPATGKGFKSNRRESLQKIESAHYHTRTTIQEQHPLHNPAFCIGELTSSLALVLRYYREVKWAGQVDDTAVSAAPRRHTPRSPGSVTLERFPRRRCARVRDSLSANTQ